MSEMAKVAFRSKKKESWQLRTTPLCALVESIGRKF